MAKDNNKELIDDIVDKMKAHELPYLEGAWEKFASNNIVVISKKQTNWKYWSAAAAILCIASVSILYMKQGHEQKSPTIANVHVEQKSTQERSNLETIEVDSSAPALGNNAKASQLAGSVSSNSNQNYIVPQNINEDLGGALRHDLPVIAKVINHDNEIKEAIATQSTAIEETLATKKQREKSNNFATNNSPTKNNDEHSTRSVAEKLERLGSLYPSNSEKHDFASAIKKWEVGAFVAPSSTVDQMSLGGGLSLAYQVTDKISIRSGVSMQQYGAGANRQNNFGALQSANMSYNNMIANNSAIKNDESLLLAKQAPNKELSAVNNKLLTIDIPVDVRYHVSKTFYTSVGVSYVGVLDQTQENYFVNGINENTAADNGNAVYSPENMKQSFKGNAVSTNDFNGFINFSIGKKMQVGKKLSIAVEPFVKLPVGGLKSTDFNYTNGGLKVVTSF